MACGTNSNESPGNQISLDQDQGAQKSSENEEKLRQHYIHDVLPKTAPISIPSNANVTVQNKQEYDQVQYKWNHGDWKYLARWHTRTPNSPEFPKESWVVERHRPGIGHGSNVRPAVKEVLVGEKKWISKSVWQDAIAAKRNGTETREQKELLNHGHWNVKK